ncbi:MAG: PrsW family intramembrane metalloprotease [Myxococcaceae bacterium]|nr:PrsW family intramembrane metalloprotease [Myxococcaceae bacterium]
MNWLAAVAGALPALVLMGCVDRLDAQRPEPRRQLRRVAVAGALATPLVFFAERLVTPLFSEATVAGALGLAFIATALLEESAKALALYWAVWRHPAFDERLDGIVYATRAGLGFALVENVGYLLGTREAVSFWLVFWLRALLSVPSHAIDAGFMGYFAARRRFDGHGPGLGGGLVLAILWHGLYNASLFVGSALAHQDNDAFMFFLPVPVLTVAGGYLVLRSMAQRALALDDAAHGNIPHLRLPKGAGFILN